LVLFALSGLFAYPSIPESYADFQCPSSISTDGKSYPLDPSKSGTINKKNHFECSYSTTDKNDPIYYLTGYMIKFSLDWNSSDKIDGVPISCKEPFGQIWPNGPRGSTVLKYQSMEKQIQVSVSLANKISESLQIQNLAKNMMSSVTNQALSCSTGSISIEESKSNTYPIIFLPGVGGSTLYDNSFQLWPAPIGDTTKMFLDSNGLPRSSLTAKGIFDFGPSATNFYGSLMDKLDQTEDYSIDKNLISYPYDWRLPLENHIKDLDKKVNQMRAENHSDKVILIAHSMGGVIAKAYAQELGKDKVEMVITIGTPYFGSVKPFYALADGYDFGNPAFSYSFMKKMAQNTPGVYHLVAPYDFVFDDGKAINNDYLMREIKYASLGENVNTSTTPNTVPILDKNNLSPNPKLVQMTKTFNSKFFGSKSNPIPLPSGIKHYAIIGTGVSTLGQYHVIDRDPEALQAYVEFNHRQVIFAPAFVDGDGTVPLDSSEYPTAKIYRVKDQFGNSAAHGDLPNNSRVQTIVLDLLQGIEPNPSPYSYSSLRVTSGDAKSNFVIPNYSFLKMAPATIDFFDSDTLQANTPLGKSQNTAKDLVGMGSQIGKEVLDKSIDSGQDALEKGTQAGQMAIDKSSELIKQVQDKGGGCLIATAAYGTELAPQVQFLREIRDNTVMSTTSGSAFMSGFNQLYYSFSPTISDMERENPVFQQAVRTFITPMISTLSIMTLADDGSEAKVLGLGLSVIALNMGMYIAVPAIAVWQVRKRL